MESMVGMALPTMAIMVSVFLLGMGLGAYIFSKIGLSPSWTSKVFAINQVLLAIFGLIFVASGELKFLSFLTVSAEKWLFAIYTLRLALICLFFLIPAMLIGAGFSLLLRSQLANYLGNTAQKLYLVNSLGTVCGAILAGFVLLPNFGIAKSTVFAVILNLVAGLIIWLVDKLVPSADVPLEMFGISSENKVANENKTASFSLLVIMVPSFFNMLLELLFVRLYVLFMGSTAFAFSLVLAMQLFALACGAFVANFVYKPKKENCWQVFAFLHIFAALWLLLALFVLPEYSAVLAAQRHFLQSALCLPPLLVFSISNAIVLLFSMFVPCFCLGANLPVYFRSRQDFPDLFAIKSTYVYAFNLFASVLGCLAGGILVIPCLSQISKHGIYLALVLGSLVILFLGLLIYRMSNSVSGVNRSRNTIWLFSVASSVALVLFVKPIWKQPLLNKRLPLLFYQEGLNSTVSLTANAKENVVLLQTDGQTEATLPLDPKLPAPTSDECTQTLLGLLPIMFSLPQPKDVFLLGLGSGVTAKAILYSPEVEKLTVAEIEPAVIAAAQYLEPIINKNVYQDLDQGLSINRTDHKSSGLKDKRMSIKISDGCNVLSMFDHSYDVIVSQPGEPWRGGSKHLYTFEFWQLVKSRLRPEGIFCQWLPLYGVDGNNLLALCQTFAAVFPDTFVIRDKHAGELILLAVNSKDRNPSSGIGNERSNLATLLPMVKTAASRSRANAMRDALIRFDFDNLSDLLNTFCMNPKAFQNWCWGNTNLHKEFLALNKDDFPIVQYHLQSLVIEKGIAIYLPADVPPKTKVYFPRIKSENFINVSSRLQEAKVLIVEGDLPAAVICLRDLLKQQPNNFAARFILGKILCSIGDSNLGLTEIKWASKIEPENPQPNLYVTAYWALNGNWPLAQENLFLLEKKLLHDDNVSYLADKIKRRQTLLKTEVRTRKLLSIL